MGQCRPSAVFGWPLGAEPVAEAVGREAVGREAVGHETVGHETVGRWPQLRELRRHGVMELAR